MRFNTAGRSELAPERARASVCGCRVDVRVVRVDLFDADVADHEGDVINIFFGYVEVGECRVV